MSAEDSQPSTALSQILHARAQQRLRMQALPWEDPSSTFGGPGSGFNCALCDAPIHEQEMELELEFRGSRNMSLRFHPRCHSIWDYERIRARP